METHGSISEDPALKLFEASNGVGAGLVGQEEAWYGFRITVSAVLLLELLLGVGGNLTVLVLYCGHCSLLESVSHAVTLSLHTLDLLLCLLCLPITATLLLMGATPHHTLLCCLHEAAATFASVGTALNLLLISLDRYDISVRPANRLLTPRRAAFLLIGVWVVSFTVPLLPFVEAELANEPIDEAPVYSNSTLLCSQLIGTLQAHLLLQVPIFLCSLAVMLFTYSRILQALRIRIGHPARAQRDTTQLKRHNWQRRKKSARLTENMTRTISPPALSTGPLVVFGVGASVSAILALRRAVRRHRDRRERQKRVFRMSVIIVLSFLLCWAPLSITPLLWLAIGPSEWLERLRVCFLVLAYWTVVLHPLLYAFTRQKLRKVLHTRLRRLRTNNTHTVIQKRTGNRRKHKADCSDATDRCLMEAMRE
ncbi:G-protein coupled receptor 22 [Trichomycterus rosablanca]|uniref:G-protein coupled receptor 22 n=1 Tax=Trichomycterus rosablanca TaxID=2290929 RepID=UPI002F35E66D